MQILGELPAVPFLLAALVAPPPGAAAQAMHLGTTAAPLGLGREGEVVCRDP